MNEKQVNYLQQAGFKEIAGYLSLSKKYTKIETVADGTGKIALQFFVGVSTTGLQALNELKKEIGEAELIIEIFNTLADK